MHDTPATQTRDQKIARFRGIRRKLAGLSHDWQAGATPEGNGILARLIPQQTLEPVLTFDVYADAKDIIFVTDAPADMCFLVGLIIELDEEILKLQPPPHAPSKPTNYAANCAMACKSAQFQLFMHIEHGVDNPSDHVRVENKVKSMLGIHSKKELDQNPVAAEAWKKLRRDAEDWNKRRAK